MPYCSQCGNPVRDADRFCRHCGRQQPTAEAAAPSTVDSGALSPRGVATLCYIPWLGWIAAVYVLVADRFRNLQEVRFHAYQGLYLFVAWMLARYVVGMWVELLFGGRSAIDHLLELAVLILWVFMLVKTASGERYSLPVIGDLAEKSL